MSVKDDDLNHLYLSCRMTSEMGSGLRYAYSRLDIIDRKASETFRSYTFIFGLLVGLKFFGGVPLVSAAGVLNTLSLWIYAAFACLAVIAVLMAIGHKQISSLRFHRIDAAALDASRISATDAAIGLASPTAAPALLAYLDEISTVTIDREKRLRYLGRLYSFGLVLSLLEAVMMFFAIGPLHSG